MRDAGNRCISSFRNLTAELLELGAITSVDRHPRVRVELAHLGAPRALRQAMGAGAGAGGDGAEEQAISLGVKVAGKAMCPCEITARRPYFKRG